MQLIECVPNFSEGRNQQVIKQIAEAIEDVPGTHLLDIDSNFSANRTVMTFVSEPKAVSEAAFRAIAKAQELIDMRNQKGEHPRIGATDVCPLIPLVDVTMADCVLLSKQLGKRVSDELNIPIYLYAKSAQLPERVWLAHVRKGQYERLEQRMRDGNFAPDYGPVHFNAKSGATALGVRNLLIAFNINLNTQSRQIAQDIARSMRQARQFVQADNLNSIDGQKYTAIGWYMEEYQCAQVSMNLMDFKETPMHVAYTNVQKLALQHKVMVTGCEIIGLVPLEAMIETGRFSLTRANENTNLTEDELVKAAMDFLNLSQTKRFDPDHKILDYRLQRLM